MSEPTEDQETRPVAICPHCGSRAALAWEPPVDSGRHHYVAVDSCESGGVYGVRVVCGSCGEWEPI